MGRKAALTNDQVQYIRSSTRTLKDLAESMKVSLLTVFKAKHGQSPYNVGIYATEQEPLTITPPSQVA